MRLARSVDALITAVSQVRPGGLPGKSGVRVAGHGFGSALEQADGAAAIALLAWVSPTAICARPFQSARWPGADFQVAEHRRATGSPR